MPQYVLLACVGKLSEPFLRDGCAEYVKRLSRYLSVTVAEAPDQPDTIDEPRALRLEGGALLKLLKPDDTLVVLAVDGKPLTSEALAVRLTDWTASGKRLVFVIGGSHGLHPGVRARAQASVSLSEMTFTHGMARLILLEQLYRACRINAGDPYHK